MLAVADLTEPFDAARYVSLAEDAIAAVRSRGRVPIVVGGSGLYIRALIHGLAEGIPADPDVRAALHARIDDGRQAGTRRADAAPSSPAWILTTPRGSTRRTRFAW